MSKKKISQDQWVLLTQRLAGEVAQFFKPKENHTIQDFITTAKPDVEKVQQDA